MPTSQISYPNSQISHNLLLIKIKSHHAQYQTFEILTSFNSRFSIPNSRSSLLSSYISDQHYFFFHCPRLLGPTGRSPPPVHSRLEFFACLVVTGACSRAHISVHCTRWLIYCYPDLEPLSTIYTFFYLNIGLESTHLGHQTPNSFS